MKMISNSVVFTLLAFASSGTFAKEVSAISQIYISIGGGSCREATLKNRSTGKRIIANLKVTYVTGGVGGGGTSTGNMAVTVEPGGEKSLGCTYESYLPPASGWTRTSYDIVGARYG